MLDCQQATIEAKEEEAIAKILRLRKQKRFLIKQQAKIVRQGLCSLEELDVVLENEKREKERVDKVLLENQPLSNGSNLSGSASSVLGSSSLLADQTPFDPLLLDDLF